MRFYVFQDSARHARGVLLPRRKWCNDYVQRVGGEIHYHYSHGVSVNRQKWKLAWKRFEKSYLSKSIKTIELGYTVERF